MNLNLKSNEKKVQFIHITSIKLEKEKSAELELVTL